MNPNEFKCQIRAPHSCDGKCTVVLPADLKHGSDCEPRSEIEIQDILDKQPHEIEKAYPEAYRLARAFHELYEEFAPLFGYITNEKTRVFDPASKNGRLMAYVCYHVVKAELHHAIEEHVREIVPEEMEEEEHDEEFIENDCDVCQSNLLAGQWNACRSQILEAHEKRLKEHYRQ